VSDTLRFEQLQAYVATSLPLVFEVILNHKSLQDCLCVGLLGVEAHLVTENDNRTCFLQPTPLKFVFKDGVPL